MPSPTASAQNHTKNFQFPTLQSPLNTPQGPSSTANSSSDFSPSSKQNRKVSFIGDDPPNEASPNGPFSLRRSESSAGFNLRAPVSPKRIGEVIQGLSQLCRQFGLTPPTRQLGLNRKTAQTLSQLLLQRVAMLVYQIFCQKPAFSLQSGLAQRGDHFEGTLHKIQTRKFSIGNRDSYFKLGADVLCKPNGTFILKAMTSQLNHGSFSFSIGDNLESGHWEFIIGTKMALSNHQIPINVRIKVGFDSQGSLLFSVGLDSPSGILDFLGAAEVRYKLKIPLKGDEILPMLNVGVCNLFLQKKLSPFPFSLSQS